ncbi:hypothetical protein CCACVL1_09338 [Corchorus capsularis]|uniref:Protein kinase domain-containing protein n=1 Tax=Corchorus capsularis TaxID=210143 RepID=A0A1R3IWP8_COCAP|nr:hypothetical protein CCACVL1_09338 [Corchorus capsularis]
MENVKEQEQVDGNVTQESEISMPSSQQEEAAVKKKYGGIMPKKPPLISKDHERAYFDSADWALGKQGVEKPKGPLEALRPKLQPTQQQTRYRKSPYAPAHGEGGWPLRNYEEKSDQDTNCNVIGLVFAAFKVPESCLNLSGKLSADAFAVFSELVRLSFRNNSISGFIMDFISNQNLKDIDLSNNMLIGPIPTSLLALNFLESLQLQDNYLTGTIPPFNQPSLTVLNVSNNQLTGPIPGTPTLRSIGASAYYNNSLSMCGSSNSGSCYYTSSNETKKKSVATIFLVFDVIGLIAVILLLILYCKKSRKLKKLIQTHHLSEKDHEEELELEAAAGAGAGGSSCYKNESSIIIQTDDESNKRVFEKQGKGNLIFMGGEGAGFDMNDLLRASAEGLGKGLFGSSYKATLEGRAAVVVKRLRDLKPLSKEDFTRLLQIIADQKHPNLLPLVAYYYSKDEKLLVYKYAKHGNLFHRLHGGRGTRDRIPFRWSSRLSVVRGVARALEYLHHNTSSTQWPVPHGNLKLSNILLDENDAVLVSDYGLTSLIAIPVAAQRMVACKSPEYHTSKRVSSKSDVWTYGCLLLEILTGRLSVHSAPPGINGVDLCSWVHRAVREEWTAEIFDMEISVQRSAAAGMLKLLQVAMRCCDKNPEKRPEMTEIVRELDSIKGVESDEDDELSMDQSLTDESFSTNASSLMLVGAADRTSW